MTSPSKPPSPDFTTSTFIFIIALQRFHQTCPNPPSTFFPILVIAMRLIPSTPLSSTRNTLSTSLLALTSSFHNHAICPSTGSSHTLPRSQPSSSQSNIGNHALTLHDPNLISSTTTALPIPMLPAHCQSDSTIHQIREFLLP